MNTNDKNNSPSAHNGQGAKRTPKQTAALLCAALLVLLYLATLIVALLDFPGAGRLFQACLVATIGLPILCWIYIWMYGLLTGKHTIASPDLFQSGPADTVHNETPSKEEPRGSSSTDTCEK